MNTEEQNKPQEASNEHATAAEPVAESVAAATSAPSDLARQLAEANDRLLRAMADIANVQRRATKERMEARRQGMRDCVRALLPCFDNLERAVASANADESSPVIQGVRMVCSTLPRALEECGVTVVTPQDGVFDPRFHEAIGQVMDATVPAGTVLMVQEKGYLLGELVIRPARVIVSAQPSPESGAA